MGYIKEKASWFLNHNNPMGTQESTFQKKYIFGDLINKYKMFLKGDYPSQTVFQKLFSSFANILTTDHTAFEQQAGLVQKCTDAKAITRTSTDNGRLDNTGGTTGSSGISTDNTTGSSPNVELTTPYFATCVLPHQLPNIHNILNVDGIDTYGTPSIAGGINIIPVSTVLNSPLGRTRKNFIIKVSVKESVKIDTDGSIHLVNDDANRTNKVYTGSGWVKGKTLSIDVITNISFTTPAYTVTRLTFIDGLLVDNPS